jgi:adenine-specific DNA-methyltransferase
MTAQEGHATKEQFYEIVSPSGVVFTPPKGRCWGISKATFEKLRQQGRIYFGKNGDSQPNVIRYLSEIDGYVPWTWWPHDEVGHTDESKKEIHALFGKVDAFDTPKPERLMKRIIEIATNPGDLVLDSFAGSGTTGAVAHKMGRRWIMVEVEEHCHTLVIPRLTKVIDGEDKGGVTEAVGWPGGGGFRYFKLAPSLLETDRHGREVISKSYNAEMLAAALCKIEGFTYAPSDAVYWQHGSSTERDFIYVTTQTLGPQQLASLSEEVGTDRSLLVLCSAFRGNVTTYPNLTVKKIPNHIRARCEWGHDDYSLNVENLPKAPPKADPDRPSAQQERKATRQQDLFGDKGGSR